MKTTYTREGGKLKESTMKPIEVSYSYGEILTRLETYEKEKTLFLASRALRNKEWEERKTKAEELGLDK